jgi:2-dehydropantoate 2-reductase
MRIAVVGAGAIGTWLGAALSRAGHEVTLIARGAHLAAILEHGVEVTGAEEYVAHPRATADAGEVGPVDAVILAVKAHDQAAAGPAVSALLGQQTVVVGAQNGIPWWYFHGLPGPFEDRRIEAVDPGGAVSAAIAPERAVGLVVYLGADVPQPGTVHTRPEAGLVVGSPAAAGTSRAQGVADVFESAGFPVRRSPDIRTEIWTKLMGNVSFNLISLLTRATLGQICRHPGSRATVSLIMAEAVEIARAVGANPTISIEERLKITERLGEHKPSTLQDLEAGKRLELDAIAGAVVELADLTGRPAPTLRAVYALADLEARALGLR